MQKIELGHYLIKDQDKYSNEAYAKFFHFRNFGDIGTYLSRAEAPWAIPLPFGGATYCILEDENQDILAFGYAVCSEQDNFNKKLGRTIALGRALKSYENQA